MRIGQYKVGDLIGEGGMGRVYRATDPRLGRDVAIKVLPESFVADAARVARFEREAQLLASLNHPNIGAIYGLEEGALILELVDGPTLADRLRRGPIPLDEALPIARQIADALDAAHEKGIVHRDLKPSNVKLRPDGTVKVLDFGLAKMAGPIGEVPALSQSPTMLTASMPGTILGTAAYMAPEQAKGKEVDRRADIWAFGCVLFEMLAGRPVFNGETVSEVLAGVLKADPDWTALPPDTPDNVRRLLRRCLDRDLRKRLQHVGDARLELDEPSSAPPADGRIGSPPNRREAAGWTLAVLFAIVAVIAVIGGRASPPGAAEVRLEIAAPRTPDPVSLALSPDGSKIAFSATGDQGAQLWLRSLDAVDAHPLSGTQNARLPFWSPDNRSIGFFADSKLKRIDLDTGAVRTLATAANGFGGSWSRDGAILFAPLATGGIERLPAAGGDPVPVTRLEPQHLSHRSPHFLPDGRHFLFHATGSADSRGVYVGALNENGKARRLLDADAGAAFAAGHVLFLRQGRLFAQQFDPETLSLSGDASLIAEQVAVNAQTAAAVSVSTGGTIAYRAGPAAQTSRQLAWFDRSGKPLGELGEEMNFISNPNLSPDGRTIALGRNLNGNVDVWLQDAARGSLIRLTTDPRIDNFPVWSSDGSRVFFESYAGGRAGDLYEKAVAGSDGQQLVLSTPDAKFPTDCSRDDIVLFETLDRRTGFDLWALKLAGDRKPFAVVRTDADERNGQFSPDGKWIAYESNETGRFEVYVQAFASAGRKIPISTNGGVQPRWRADGQELFYLTLDNRLVSLAIRSQGDTVEPGQTTPLFATQVTTLFGVSGMQYAVSRDAQRFLIASSARGPDANTSPIAIVLNWKPK